MFYKFYAHKLEDRLKFVFNPDIGPLWLTRFKTPTNQQQQKLSSEEVARRGNARPSETLSQVEYGRKTSERIFGMTHKTSLPPSPAPQ